MLTYILLYDSNDTTGLSQSGVIFSASSAIAANKPADLVSTFPFAKK